MAEAYPISAVSRLTGLPLDTLRAWERRYQAVSPSRSARGRVYNERQIQRLLLLRRAVESGHSIGQIAKLEDDGLRAMLDRATSLVETRSAQSAETTALINPVLHAIERFDSARAERELNWAAAAVGRPKDLVHQVALPLMRTVGERWHQGKFSIAQEHMLTSLLTGLLSSFTRANTVSDPPARVLFATLKEERHGFPNLAAALLTAAGGLGVIHLGTDLPKEEIVLAARKSGANAILLSISKSPNPEFRQCMQYIARKVPEATSLWLGSSPEIVIEKIAGTRWMTFIDFPSLEGALRGLGARL
jgi:DNA-binding transcriptional MerR regulator/methylmalonyl-CoA mutase cobalamin-binding subunit